jgi:hypothetical protein
VYEADRRYFMKKGFSEKVNKVGAWLVAVFFVISSVPVFYMAFYARATGDDIGYSILSHKAWEETHSLIAVAIAAMKQTVNSYNSWNGNYFTGFLFSFQPEVFSSKAYFMTTFIWDGLFITMNCWLLYIIMCKIIGLKKYVYFITVFLSMFVMFQFVKSTAAAMYWWVGVTDYIGTQTLATAALALCLNYLYRGSNKKDIILLSVLMFMIGGGSFFAPVFIFLLMILLIVMNHSGKRTYWLLVPFFIGVSGFIFQCKCPGYRVRGGNAVAFNVMKAGVVIAMSLRQGCVYMAGLMRRDPFVYVALLLIAVAVWKAYQETEDLKIHFTRPLLFVIYMYGTYSAMFAPVIYSEAKSVSGGPDDISLIVFMLTSVISIIYILGWLTEKLRKKGNVSRNIWTDTEKYTKCIQLPILTACIILTLGLHMFTHTTDKKIVNYIISGQAADFKVQMQQETKLLTETKQEDVIVPEINNEQGPLLHMPITNKPDAWTNTIASEYYGKNSVTAVKREEWNQKYKSYYEIN